MKAPVVVAALLLVVCGCERRSPNLLLVTIDTLRADAVGAYGGEQPTRGLDRLAERSVVFENAYSTAPFTGPSHASILSARHPSKHGVLFNGHRVRGQATEDSVFVSEHLRGLGYRTGAVVSAAPVRAEYGFGRGFDVFEEDCPAMPGEAGADGECVLAAARRFLTEPDQAPFFLWVHLFDPHYPYTGPPYLWRERGLDPERDQLRAELGPETAPKEKLRAAYLADVAQADGYLERLLDLVEGAGLANETVVVVTADHGEYLADHDLFGHHGLRDEVLHVPLLIAGPGLAPGRDERLVSTLDAIPTALDLMGVPPLASGQGRSRVSKDVVTDAVFAEWRHFNVVSGKKVWPGSFQLGVRTESRKLIQDRLFPDAGLLFDLSKDPAENRNLFGATSASPDALHARLERHVADDLEKEHVRRGDLPFDETTLERLRKLGYVE